MKVKKNILILEHESCHAQKHKELLENSGFKCLVEEVQDAVEGDDYRRLFRQITGLIIDNQINLVLTDTGFFGVSRAVHTITGANQKIKAIYLNYLGDKYKARAKGSHKPHLRILVVDRNPQILSNMVKHMLA